MCVTKLLLGRRLTRVDTPVVLTGGEEGVVEGKEGDPNHTK